MYKRSETQNMLQVQPRRAHCKLVCRSFWFDFESDPAIISQETARSPREPHLVLVQQNAIGVARLVISPVHARKALALALAEAATAGVAAGEEAVEVEAEAEVEEAAIKRHGMNSRCRLMRC